MTSIYAEGVTQETTIRRQRPPRNRYQCATKPQQSSCAAAYLVRVERMIVHCRGTRRQLVRNHWLHPDQLGGSRIPTSQALTNNRHAMGSGRAKGPVVCLAQAIGLGVQAIIQPTGPGHLSQRTDSYDIRQSHARRQHKDRNQPRNSLKNQQNKLTSLGRIIHERSAAEPQFDHLPRQRTIRPCSRVNNMFLRGRLALFLASDST